MYFNKWISMAFAKYKSRVLGQSDIAAHSCLTIPTSFPLVLVKMAIRELPAIEWLGYSIDLSSSPTMDLRAANQASNSVLKGRRIINFPTDENLRQVELNGVMYDVPEVVRISSDSLFQGSFQSYPTGENAQNAFRADAGLPSRYFAVTGTDNAVALALDRSFVRGNQYALYCFTHSAYAARLADYHDMLNESALLRGVEDLPQQFDGNNGNVLVDYKEFLQRFGTHAIVSVNYGARFQLNGWASNGNTSVNAKFATDVKAYFNGIPNGGEYDPSVKSEAQYKLFLEYFQRIVTVVGGDSELAASVTSDPTDWNTYARWSATVFEGKPMHINFRTTAIWTLMSESHSNVLRAYGEQLNRAFTWILAYPRIYKTAVVFDIQSDWAEFNLLTPNAVIQADSANPYPSQTISSLTRVQWGKEHSHAYQRQTLRFFIINDGSPIDLSISHGSNAAQPGQGKAEALIERKQYLNDKITDNVWNTEWFFGAPVASAPVSFRLNSRDGGYPWEDIRDAYFSRTAALEATGELDHT